MRVLVRVYFVKYSIFTKKKYFFLFFQSKRAQIVELY